jgi:endoglucanase Acf2
MVIINPSTSYLRPYQFVKEEWERLFNNGRADIDGEHFSIIYAALLIILNYP